MHRYRVLALASCLMMPGVTLAQDTAAPACPVTIGSNSLGPPFPESESWYGSESLAVMLPVDGTWAVTAPGARIAVKLPVWSFGFKPGMEENLIVSVDSLSGGRTDAVVKDITNAGADSLGGWTMLVGIDFPTAGCWQLTLDYFGQSLSFVVATIEPDLDGTAT